MTTWRGTLLGLVAIVGLVQCGYAFVTGATAFRPANSVCEDWHRDALASLEKPNTGPQPSHDLQIQFIDAARTNCMAGRVGLARRDYDAIRAALSPALHPVEAE
jgi:hypothetical protein